MTVSVRQVVEGIFRQRRITFGSDIIMTACDGSFWGPMEPGVEVALYIRWMEGRPQVRLMHLLRVARQFDRRFGQGRPQR